MSESMKEWSIITGYAVFMLCILFVAAVLLLTVDLGTIVDGNGNIVGNIMGRP